MYTNIKEMDWKKDVSSNVAQSIETAFETIHSRGWKVIAATVFTPLFAYGIESIVAQGSGELVLQKGSACRDEVYIVAVQPGCDTLVQKVDDIARFLEESEAGRAHSAGDVVPLPRAFGLEREDVDLVVHEVADYIDLLFQRKHRAIELLWTQNFIVRTVEWDSLRSSVMEIETVKNIVDYHYVNQCWNRCYKGLNELKRHQKDLNKSHWQQWFESNRVLLMIEKFISEYKPDTATFNLDLCPQEGESRQLLTSILNGTVDLAANMADFEKRHADIRPLLKKIPTGLRQSELVETKSDNIGVSKWLENQRMISIPFRYPLLTRPFDSTDNLCLLLERLQTDIPPTHVIMLCRTGSYMYDLQVESSDEDYYIVYTYPTENMLSVYPGKRSVEKHVEVKSGQKQGIVEYSGYEACFYIENLMKGNPRNVEPLFARSDRMDYESPLWLELKALRNYFITQRTVSQYLGFISNRLKVMEKGRMPPGKALCHIFHKLYQVQNILDGIEPEVQSTGWKRDYILSLRRGQLEGESSKELLLQKVEESLADISERRKRTNLVPECPTAPLREWLRRVRLTYITDSSAPTLVSAPKEPIADNLDPPVVVFRPSTSN